MSPTRRETKLLQLVHFLWTELRKTSDNPGAIEWAIRQEGLGWAIGGPDHIDDENWLTPDQIAHELGYQQSTVHVWAHRYGLRQINGRYRWGDIKQIR
jgi:hypothetical protein